jgi:hypothetical protein
MTTNKNQVAVQPNTIRYVILGGLVAAAFFGAYRFAMAQSAGEHASSLATAAIGGGAATGGAPAGTAPNVSAGTGAGSAAAGGSGGGCCGGGGGGSCCGGGGGSSQQTVAGATTLSGGVQKVVVDLTTGSYSPNQIAAKAGIPIELDFKGPASGCNGTVVSQQLGFQQDVSNGGAIKIGALQPGTYTWTCGMGMYIGRIVVK